MVYWVIAKSMIRADAGPRSVTLVRQGPFESHVLAVQAQRTVFSECVNRIDLHFRPQAEARWRSYTLDRGKLTLHTPAAMASINTVGRGGRI